MSRSQGKEREVPLAALDTIKEHALSKPNIFIFTHLI